MADSRELDVIIFGATGFTGKYTIFEGVKILESYKWGIAGRNRSKLESVLKEIGEKLDKDLSSTPIVLADVDDPASLRKMAEKCKVVINCTGPYRLWGEPVVKACIEAGTHQVDVTGEPQYMERMVLEYNEKAKEKGSYIVNACGFDSVPVDLGVVFLERHFEGTVNSVEQYLTTNADEIKRDGAVLHYGTWASAVYGVSHWDELKDLRKKLFKEPLPSFKPKLKAKPVVHKSSKLNKWCLPFLGADSSIVYRSQRQLFELEKKRPIQIKSYFGVNSIVEVIAFILFGIIFALMSKFSCGRHLLLTYPKIFSFGLASHEGPSEASMRAAKFTMHLFGKGWTDKIAEATDNPSSKPDKDIYVRVSGSNPGYGFTCVALLLSAVMLLKDPSKLPKNGGVYTPAVAFGKTDLIEELSKNGATFEVVGAQERLKDE